jgi:hypothetical protein
LLQIYEYWAWDISRALFRLNNSKRIIFFKHDCLNHRWQEILFQKTRSQELRSVAESLGRGIKKCQRVTLSAPGDNCSKRLPLLHGDMILGSQNMINPFYGSWVLFSGNLVCLLGGQWHRNLSDVVMGPR